jgi:hypothetical protein
MWMEGFPHASVDTEHLTQQVQALCTQWWEVMASVHPTSDDADDTRDALDKLALQPMQMLERLMTSSRVLRSYTKVFLAYGM